MSKNNRIAELSSVISQRAAEINEYLLSNNLPQPSFEADGPEDLSLPPKLQAARHEIANATLELRELMIGPRGILMGHEHRNAYLAFILRFKIYEHVPLTGSIAYSELAKSIGINEKAVTNLMRFAAASRIFSEPQPGHVAHSAASKVLATDPTQVDWLSVHTFELWKMALSLVPALEKYPDCNEPTETAVAVANGCDGELSFYDILKRDPERARRFGSTMTSFQKGEQYSMQHLVNGFDWAGLEAGSVVVDLGGSRGDAAIAVAKAFPTLKFVVEDLPQAVKSALPVPYGLNVEFMEHDFFTPQVVTGAEVYYFRWIFHNHSDVYCVRILRALIPALRFGARVLVMDAIMPPFGVVDNMTERAQRNMDAGMLQLFNAREREEREWQTLIEMADERFELVGIKQPEGSRLSVIEVIWRG